MEATLHRDHYLEESWFAKECEHIFFAEWSCVARDSLLIYSCGEFVGEIAV